MEGVWSFLTAVPSRMYNVLVRNHLRRLYLHGPAFMGVGFWQGRAPTDICAHLTKFTSDFWTAHPEECDLIIQQHLRTFFVSVETALYGALLYRCVSGYLTHVAFVRPILRELRQLRADRADRDALRIDGIPAPRVKGS